MFYLHELWLEHVPMIFESGIKVVDCPECGLLNHETLLIAYDCSHCGADLSLPSLSQEPNSIGRTQWQVIQEMRDYSGENWYRLNKYMLRSKDYWDEYLKLDSTHTAETEFDSGNHVYLGHMKQNKQILKSNFSENYKE